MVLKLTRRTLSATLGACAVMTAPAAVHATQGAKPVPEALKAPVDQVLAFELQATGVQIYECRASQDDPGRFEWAFKAPQAELSDATGRTVGRHYGGPTWEGVDGSKVVGEVKAKDTSRSAGSIPWLLLAAKSCGCPTRPPMPSTWAGPEAVP